MSLKSLFGDLIAAPLKGFFSVFRADSDTTHVSRPWSTEAPASASVAKLEQLVGGDLLTEFGYALGADHPRLNETPGQSMRDAFSAFEALFKKRSRVRLEDRLFQGELDQHIVTFGSPSSNQLSRRSLGYHAPDPQDAFILREATDFGIKPAVRYVLSSANQTVHRGRYFEPHWSLSTPEQQHTPRLTPAGHLREDYLVLTCTPNLLSAPTVSTLCARLERREWLNAPPREGATAAEYQAYRRSLEEAGKAAQGPIHKQLIIGGLHGPGTAAGAFLLRPKVIDQLTSAVKKEGLDGKFWQAVVRVSVELDGQRDKPTLAHMDELEVHPVGVP